LAIISAAALLAIVAGLIFFLTQKDRDEDPSKDSASAETDLSLRPKKKNQKKKPPTNLKSGSPSGLRAEGRLPQKTLL
jgi:hypothetical protein